MPPCDLRDTSSLLHGRGAFLSSLASEAMTTRDHRSYIRYYFKHPEDFEDKPPLGVGNALWHRKIQEGVVTLKDVDRLTQQLRNKWRSYHRAKAEALGFDVNLDSLESDLCWLALEFRLVSNEV